MLGILQRHIACARSPTRNHPNGSETAPADPRPTDIHQPPSYSHTIPSAATFGDIAARRRGDPEWSPSVAFFQPNSYRRFDCCRTFSRGSTNSAYRSNQPDSHCCSQQRCPHSLRYKHEEHALWLQRQRPPVLVRFKFGQ